MREIGLGLGLNCAAQYCVIPLWNSFISSETKQIAIECVGMNYVK